LVVQTLGSTSDLAQAVLIVLAGFALLAAIVGAFLAPDETPLGIRVAALVAIASGCLGVVVLSIAAKQAALLLVDIADCQIQRVNKS
jgi:hypothetical protein